METENAVELVYERGGAYGLPAATGAVSSSRPSPASSCGRPAAAPESSVRTSRRERSIVSGDGSLSPPRPEGCLSSAYSQSGGTDRQPSPPTRIVPSALAAHGSHRLAACRGRFLRRRPQPPVRQCQCRKTQPRLHPRQSGRLRERRNRSGARATIPLVANGRINIGSSFTGAQPRRFITRRVTARSRQASSSRSASRRQCDVRDHATRAEPSVTRYRDQRQIRVPQGQNTSAMRGCARRKDRRTSCGMNATLLATTVARL